MTTPYDNRLFVRLSKEEKAVIANRARKLDLSMSEYVRRCALRNDSRPVVEVDASMLRQIHANLKRAGSNLNQISRWLNSHRNQPGQFEEPLVEALAETSQAASDVAAFIADVKKSI